MHCVYEKTNIDNIVSYGLLSMSVSLHPDFVCFAVYQGAKHYDNLKAVVEDFHEGTKGFCNTGLCVEKYPGCSYSHSSRSIESNVEIDRYQIADMRPSDRFYHAAGKVDKLAEKIANLSLIVKITRMSNLHLDMEVGE